VKDFKENSPRFCYYLLKSMDFSGMNAGSGVPTLNRNHLHPLPVLKPSIEEQNSIAETLGALDDRITLLRETNKTLEAIAQAIFKSWFIDFDPVRAKMEGRAPAGLDEETTALFPDELAESDLGLVPKGWDVKTVGETVDTVGGATPDTKNPDYWEPAEHHWTSPKDLSGLSDPVLLSTERRISSSGLSKIGSGLLPVGTLLMSSRAPIGYLAIADMPVAINQGYIAIPPGGQLSPLYMLRWCQANMEGIKGRANGSTFMEISKKAFRPIPILVPPPKLLDVFEETCGTLFDRLVLNSKQAKTLAEIRDALLPRLISGKLQVLDSEKFAPQ
jgi:type I restriction enzyme S subunit